MASIVAKCKLCGKQVKYTTAPRTIKGVGKCSRCKGDLVIEGQKPVAKVAAPAPKAVEVK